MTTRRRSKAIISTLLLSIVSRAWSCIIQVAVKSRNSSCSANCIRTIKTKSGKRSEQSRKSFELGSRVSINVSPSR